MVNLGVNSDFSGALKAKQLKIGNIVCFIFIPISNIQATSTYPLPE
jgi:hypothetical protein